MSKKTDKKKRGKRVGICLPCGKGLREHDRRCRGCRRPNRLYVPRARAAAKVAVPFLTKAAGGGKIIPLAVKQAPARCPFGHGPGRRGQRYCSSCGAVLDFVSAAGATFDKAVDARRAATFGSWASAIYGESDPTRREALIKSVTRHRNGGAA